MLHTVSTAEFEGPLGVLLELIERGNVQVTAISVADITADYLKRIKQIEQRSPESLSEFVQLGARLLYIKSLALLPGPASDESDQELIQLNLELEEYRRLQTASRQLARRLGNRTWERPVSPRLPMSELPLPKLTLTQITAAFTNALARHQPVPEPQTIRTHISLEAKLSQLRTKLADGFDLQQLLYACRDRLEIIVTFLALLELIRDGSAQVAQGHQFAPITVQATKH